jgi:hypothetical protein
MMIRGDWRDFLGGPLPSRPPRGADDLFAAVVFGIVWVTSAAVLLALPVLLRFL